MISRMPSPRNDSWNACALPWKLVMMEIGSVESASACTSSTAWPIATPRARSNERVTDGSWPVWLIVSGPRPCGEIGDGAERDELARRTSGYRAPKAWRDRFDSGPAPAG